MMTLVKFDLPTVEDVVARLKAGEVVRIEIPADNFDRRPLETLVTSVKRVMQNYLLGSRNTYVGRTTRIVLPDGQIMRREMSDGSSKPIEGRSAIAWKRRYPDLCLVVDIEPKP